ncbi:MAG: hypothetical protein WCT08_04220 [Patescibacteria group bacterium]|jgi:hypothetical protein
MNENNPLNRLLVSDSQDVNKEELANLLEPYVFINKDSKSFDFSSKFHGLPTHADRILIIFAAVKARHIILQTEDRITPSEIIKMEVAAEGSIKGTLKRLSDDGEIKADKGKYYLPNYKIPKLVEHFKSFNK